MNVFEKAWLLAHVLWWRLTWSRHDTRQRVLVEGNSRFMGPREAVAMIPDHAVVGIAGFAASMRCSILYWAMRECFEESGRPCGLSVITSGGSGGRGRIPGTAEELGVPGLLSRFITGHAETYKSLLRLTDAGQLDFQCMPLGMLSLLLGKLGDGETSLLSDTGIGTFMDPRCGRGTPVIEGGTQLVEVLEGRLRYSLPPIDVAIFNAPSADRAGNIYARGAALTAETLPVVKAARRNNGLVIANVARVVNEGHAEVFIPKEEVDAIVVWKDAEQTCSIPHRRHWDCFTLDSKTPMRTGIKRVKFINHVVGVTPRRQPVDDALARLAASIFVEHARKGDVIDIGVGLPEEVSRLLYQSGAIHDILLLTESGVFGGLPTPGVFFGAAINPKEIVSTTEAFKRIYQRLDGAILGALEIDSLGNNNVSKRGDGAIHYVGPGGFIDLTTCAKLVVFCCAWGAKADICIEGDAIRVHHTGKPKFVEQVSEVTFSGPEAVKQGKQVFYVTHVGAFRLTSRGMELFRVMPGVDIQRDIIEACPMRVVLPENGLVPVADASIVTGRDFVLQFSA